VPLQIHPPHLIHIITALLLLVKGHLTRLYLNLPQKLYEHIAKLPMRTSARVS
jgi:hypothetical protein